MSSSAALWATALLALTISVCAVPLVSEAQTAVVVEPTNFSESYAIENWNVTSHSPYNGSPATTTGALSTKVPAPSIAPAPPPPQIVAYPANGDLPATNAMHAERRHRGQWLRACEFEEYGINAEDRHLILHMADQEIGHASVIANMLGPNHPKQCAYDYPVSNAEVGAYGFLPHLNSGSAAQMLLQSITVEARQQMIFRQFGDQFSVPEWHTPGIPQSWAWTLLAPYIRSSESSPHWDETTGPYANTLSTEDIEDDELCINTGDETLDCYAAISRNRSIPLSYPGRQVFLQWDEPGKLLGPNNSYVTTTNVKGPKFAAWLSQLNVTYTPLLNVSVDEKTAYTI
ncbi:hypothetical protein OQA88_11577 [Cercophora sp. LCS_1]